MRIIAGRLGGRNFASPRGQRTHPMSDKVRGALFGALGDIGGLAVLDAFGGSGALSFEAVSRGAATAVVVEADRAAQQTIAENVATLDVGVTVKLVRATATAWLSTAPETETFDIVLCDPPYDNLQPALLTKLAARAKPQGVVVLSLPPAANFRLAENYQLLAEKRYGDATLVFYRRIR